MSEQKPTTPKEVDIFNRFSGRTNKLKVIAITLAIALVIFLVVYVFAKSLGFYYVRYEANGGLVFGKEIEADEYRLFQRTKRPENLRKPGYYIAKFCTDKNLKNEYTFGKPIWTSKTLYVDWQPGVALLLEFVEGQENEDLSLSDLKLYYEEYVKAGTTYTLPLIYNLNEKSVHYGEQLLFFDNSKGEGEPIWQDTFVVDEDRTIYGKWFDTKDEKFIVDDEGTLLSYTGSCDNVFIPQSVIKIKDCVSVIGGYEPSIQDLVSDRYSVWHRVKSSLKSVYIRDSLITFGDYAFASCTALEKIGYYSDGVETIGSFAFQFCSCLKEFTMPKKVAVINPHTFESTGGNVDGGIVIKNLDNVVTVLDNAFLNSSVRELTFKSLSLAGKTCFAGTMLNSLTLDTDDVVATNVTSEELGYNGDNVLQMTVFVLGFKIYVPAQYLEEYKQTYAWRIYANYFAPIVEDVA